MQLLDWVIVALSIAWLARGIFCISNPRAVKKWAMKRWRVSDRKIRLSGVWYLLLALLFLYLVVAT
jgi:uncharacterized protein YjeT (DUF2065 family)